MICIFECHGGGCVFGRGDTDALFCEKAEKYLDLDSVIRYALLVQACGMRLTKKLWKYVPWAPRMVELLRRGYIVGKALPAIGVPMVVWQSSNDEMVSPRSAVLLRKRTHAQVDILPASTHFYYPPEDVQTVQNSFASILQLHL